MKNDTYVDQDGENNLNLSFDSKDENTIVFYKGDMRSQANAYFELSRLRQTNEITNSFYFNQMRRLEEFGFRLPKQVRTELDRVMDTVEGLLAKI